MLAKQLISGNISPLLISDTAMQALSLMEEFKVTHLPVVSSLNANEGVLLGVISEDDILDLVDPNIPIEDITSKLSTYLVLENQHVYDVLHLFGKNRISLLPVISNNHIYLGCINSENIIKYLSKFSATSQAGAIIVMEMNQNDYSLAHIAQIVESNNTKILSSYVNLDIDRNTLEVTIKLNSVSIDAVVSALKRFDYNIKYTLYDDKEMVSEIENNYDSLMKYLEI